MTVRIAIIGLGQIGTSFGLALADRKDKLQRIGYDKDIKVARQAEKLGAIDKTEGSISKAVRDSELILLCLPLNQIKDTLSAIAPELKEGAVVMETGMAKEMAAAWASELFSPGRYYVGLTPVVNPAYLQDYDLGIEAARADLFKGCLMGIVAPPQTDPGAIKLTADLAHLVGASPLFSDPMEIDGLMTSTYLLPQLVAAAMVNSTIDQPGWREARKLAGRSYARSSEPIRQVSEARALSSAAVLNRENVLRMIDSFVAALHALRMDIDESDEASLSERLERARQGRIRWWEERQTADWLKEASSDIEMPEDPGILGRLFGAGRKPKKKD
jgi:prephenate dehydrogenase